MARQLPNWLTAFLQYVEGTESPLKYHVWSALSAISSAMQRKCWLPFGHTALYPNTFIILVGPAGLKKSTSPKIVSQMLRSLRVSFSADTATKEALLLSLINSRDEFFAPINGEANKKVVYHHSLTIHSMELNVLLETGNLEKISWLTDWWDAADVWGKATIKDGELKVHNICVNLLGLSTPDWLIKSIPLEAHGGGFTSRAIFVVADHSDRAGLVPIPKLKPGADLLYKKLVHDLDEINTQLIGPFSLSAEAEELFDTIYKRIHTNAATTGGVHIAGFNERRGPHTLKVAMLLSAAESNDRIIQHRHIQQADKLLTAIAGDLDRAFGAVGRSFLVYETNAIMHAIQVLGTVRKSVLLSYFWRDIDTSKMDTIAKTLADMQKIQVVYDPTTRDYIYQWL